MVFALSAIVRMQRSYVVVQQYFKKKKKKKKRDITNLAYIFERS